MVSIHMVGQNHAGVGTANMVCTAAIESQS